MNHFFIRTAAILLAIAVMLGAMGAHALKDSLNPYQAQIYEKAVVYHFLHGIGLLITGLTAGMFNKRIIYTGWLMMAGIVLFSGSLYALATVHLCSCESMKGILGPVTPIGGVCFILAWLIMAFSIKPSSGNSSK